MMAQKGRNMQKEVICNNNNNNNNKTIFKMTTNAFCWTHISDCLMHGKHGKYTDSHPSVTADKY
jgi:hypothetical protein